MKRTLALLALSLALAAPAAAQFGGRIGSAVPNIKILIEKGTFTPTGPWDFTSPVTFSTTTIFVGGSSVSANVPILGDGTDSDPLRLDTSSVTLLGPTVDHGELSNVGANDHHIPISDTLLNSNRDDFTSLADGIETNFTISTTSADNGLFVVLDGLIQRDGIDYTISGVVISFTTAPTSDTNSLFALYLSSVPTPTSANFQVHLEAKYVHHSLTGAISINDPLGNLCDTPSFEVMARVAFSGSDITEIPNSFIGVATAEAGKDYQLRIFDLTNAQVIATSAVLTNTTPALVNLGSISNYPTGPAILEAQCRSPGGGKGFIDSISVRF